MDKCKKERILKYFLSACILCLVIFFPVQAFSQTETGSIEIVLKYTNGDYVPPSEITLFLYQDKNSNPYLEELITSNPVIFTSLPLYHRYDVEIFINGMFAGQSFVEFEINEPTEVSQEIVVPLSGGLRLQVLYDDSETPIEGAVVSIKSSDGKEWRKAITITDGKSPRFWIQSAKAEEDYYIAEVSLGPTIIHEHFPILLYPGFPRDIIIVTPWPKIIDDLITIQVYNDSSQKVSKSDGNFVAELYDNKNNKVAQSSVNFRGDAFFSNLKVGSYFLKIVKTGDSDTEPLIWSSKSVDIIGTSNIIEIFQSGVDTGVQEDVLPESEQTLTDIPSCDCVAFRFDDVQDFWLNNVQIKILQTFEDQRIPLTVGVVTDAFGADTGLVSYINEVIINNPEIFEIANHGTGSQDFTLLTKEQQSELIGDANLKIFETLGVTPKVFIPPFNNFNDDTIAALLDNGMTHLSGSTLKGDLPPYPLENAAVYRFPEVATTGIFDGTLNRFVGTQSDETFEMIQANIANYGFAVVAMHPQEFSTIENDTYANDVNNEQFLELEELLAKVQTSEIKIVPISKINLDAISDDLVIPSWIKNNAGWWANGQIEDSDFIKGLEYLIQHDIMRIPPTQKSDEAITNEVPEWIKNNAGWWADDQISDKEFVNGIEFLIKHGIIVV